MHMNSILVERPYFINGFFLLFGLLKFSIFITDYISYNTQQRDIYRVSQEECARLRESVPYVKLYRKTPKHLYPKFNGYGDIGHRKVWTSLVSAYCTLSVTSYSSVSAWPQRDGPSCIPTLSLDAGQWPWYGSYVLVYSGWKSVDNYDTSASVFVVQLMALCHSQVSLLLRTAINITETTYSCQFQYVFGNQ